MYGYVGIYFLNGGVCMLLALVRIVIVVVIVVYTIKRVLINMSEMP